MTCRDTVDQKVIKALQEKKDLDTTRFPQSIAWRYKISQLKNMPAPCLIGAVLKDGTEVGATAGSGYDNGPNREGENNTQAGNMLDRLIYPENVVELIFYDWESYSSIRIPLTAVQPDQTGETMKTVWLRSSEPVVFEKSGFTFKELILKATNKEIEYSYVYEIDASFDDSDDSPVFLINFVEVDESGNKVRDLDGGESDYHKKRISGGKNHPTQVTVQGTLAPHEISNHYTMEVYDGETGQYIERITIPVIQYENNEGA